MEEKRLHAVLDEDIEKLLDKLGQLEPIQNGEVTCHECGAPIMVKNLQIILPLPNGGFHFVCSNTDCVRAHAEKEGLPDA